MECVRMRNTQLNIGTENRHTENINISLHKYLNIIERNWTLCRPWKLMLYSWSQSETRISWTYISTFTCTGWPFPCPFQIWMYILMSKIICIAEITNYDGRGVSHHTARLKLMGTQTIEYEYNCYKKILEILFEFLLERWTPEIEEMNIFTNGVCYHRIRVDGVGCLWTPFQQGKLFHNNFRQIFNLLAGRCRPSSSVPRWTCISGYSGSISQQSSRFLGHRRR